MLNVSEVGAQLILSQMQLIDHGFSFHTEEFVLAIRATRLG